MKELLPQIQEVRGNIPERALCDRGFRGRKHVSGTAVILPGSPHADATKHAKRKARKDFGRRSAIEPVIGHLKSDYRLARNYLKGTIGDAVNLLLAAAAFNCVKWMKTLAGTVFFVFIALRSIAQKEDHTDCMAA